MKFDIELKALAVALLLSGVAGRSQAVEVQDPVDMYFAIQLSEVCAKRFQHYTRDELDQLEKAAMSLMPQDMTERQKKVAQEEAARSIRSVEDQRESGFRSDCLRMRSANRAVLGYR
jgi:hypothetical protein